MNYQHLKDKYAVVGVGYTPQGKVPGQSAISFHVEACVNAIKDAGLNKNDIDGLLLYRHFKPVEGDIDNLECGQNVMVKWQELKEGIFLPIFKPSEEFTT